MFTAKWDAMKRYKNEKMEVQIGQEIEGYTEDSCTRITDQLVVRNSMQTIIGAYTIVSSLFVKHFVLIFDELTDHLAQRLATFLRLKNDAHMAVLISAGSLPMTALSLMGLKAFSALDVIVMKNDLSRASPA